MASLFLKSGCENTTAIVRGNLRFYAKFTTRIMKGVDYHVNRKDCT